MQVILICDHMEIASKYRGYFQNTETEISLTHLVSVQELHQRVHSTQPQPELVILHLSNDADQDLRLLEQLRGVCTSEVIVAGPTTDPHLILRAIQAGANNYLDINSDSTQVLDSTLKKLLDHVQVKTNDSRLITITGASGGTGRSFLSTNLAALLSDGSSRCILADLDIRGGDAASLLNQTPQHTLATLCRNVHKLDQNLLQQALLTHESGIELLAAPNSFSEAADVTPEGVEKVLKLAMASAPSVVVDLEDFFHREQQKVLQMSSDILLMLRLDFTSIKNIRKSLEHLERLDLDMERVRLVANRRGQARELPFEKAEEVLGKSIEFSIPDDPSNVTFSINCGNPVVLECPSSPAAQAIQSIARKLQGGKEVTPPEAAIVPHKTEQTIPKPLGTLSKLALMLPFH